MEPRIQYAKTTDGVSIAYWTLGEGMPFVQVSGAAFAPIQAEWQIPEYRRWYERLAETRKAVRYDPRGFGLSERVDTDLSLEAYVLDLEAVVDRLGLETFVLSGSFILGPVAIAYAARHPERVSHLLLWCSCARVSDVYQSPQAQSMAALRYEDWQVFTETVAQFSFGWSEGEMARRWASLIRESIQPEQWQVNLAALNEVDITPLLPEIRSPTLVFHRRQHPVLDVNVARGLASRIPDARLVLLEGASLFAYVGDNLDASMDAIDEFLSEGEEEATTEAPPTAAVHTILFTDMESSTALRRKLGDAKAQELVRTHNTIVRHALKSNGGAEIKHTGDGIMASFTTASSALGCAIAIQQSVASHVQQQPGMPLGVYIGLNAGEPIAEEQDLFGTSVDLARRICDHAEPGQILAANVVRELSEGKGFLFGDIGEVVPKGFEEPVRLYEVRWRAEGSP